MNMFKGFENCESITLDLNKPIDWDEVLKNVKKHAEESFGRPDFILPEFERMYREAWQQLRDHDKKKFKLMSAKSYYSKYISLSLTSITVIS